MDSIKAPRWRGDPRVFVEDLFAWIEACGESPHGERISQLEHALQTAEQARRERAPETEVAAALLHDVGHMLVASRRPDEEPPDRDLHHEFVGARWLRNRFPAAVTEPIRLHVDAKRWLCSVDQDYWNGLSDASKHSLALQGGRFSAEELEAFQSEPHWRAAVALRRRDDAGKEVGRQTAPLESYRETLLACLTQDATA